MRLPHGYTNDTVRVSDVVHKRFALSAHPTERLATEVRALRALQGRMAVPRLRSVNAHADEITTEFVSGDHGQDLIAGGHGDSVLANLGQLLRAMTELPADVVSAAAVGHGDSLVHGDFGPQNAIFDRDSFEVLALVDWEWAHLGDPAEDLAWAEWIIRMHHPDAVGSLVKLFESYGEWPAWEVRHELMLARCRELVGVVGSDEGRVPWRERLAITEAFDELRP